MCTQGENIHGWMDEYQEAKKEIGGKKQNTYKVKTSKG